MTHKNNSEYFNIWDSISCLDVKSLQNQSFPDLYSKADNFDCVLKSCKYTFVYSSFQTKDEKNLLVKFRYNFKYLLLNNTNYIYKKPILIKKISSIDFIINKVLIVYNLFLKNITLKTTLPNQVIKSKNDIKFQHIMAKKGFIIALCPITGKILRSNKSLLFNITKWPPYIFYRFEGEEIFYLITDSYSHYFRRLCLYFPKNDLVFVFGRNKPINIENEINFFKSNMILHANLIKSYICNTSNTKRVALLTSRHFAHHLWNELSGIKYCIDNNLLPYVNIFTVFNEPLGKIESIFPQINKNKLKKLNIDNENDFIIEILKNRYFVFRLGFNYIDNELANRVIITSQNTIPKSLKQKMSSIKKNCSPIIWFSLRTDCRTWLSQENHIIHIIHKISKDYASSCILFDGFSLPLNCTDHEYLFDLKKQIKRQSDSVNYIQKRLPRNVTSFNLVGININESISWSQIIDAYVCHHGSIQHKVGWIANKKGIIHTNQISAQNELNHPTFWARENAVPPRVLCGTDVDIRFHPIEGDLRDNVQNYKLDWEIVYNALIECLNE